MIHGATRSTARALLLISLVGASGCPKKEETQASEPAISKETEADTAMNLDFDSGSPATQVGDAGADDSVEPEPEIDASTAMDGGMPQNTALNATPDAAQDILDAGSMADSGMRTAPEGFKPAGFMACDLRGVDWQTTIEEDGQWTSDEECTPDFCQYYYTYPDDPLYADTDGDGTEEAWVGVSTDITGVGAASTLHGLYVYTRDSSCGVFVAELLGGSFGWLTIMLVDGGADIVEDDFSGPITHRYRWEDGALREVP